MVEGGAPASGQMLLTYMFKSRHLVKLVFGYIDEITVDIVRVFSILADNSCLCVISQYTTFCATLSSY